MSLSPPGSVLRPFPGLTGGRGDHSPADVLSREPGCEQNRGSWSSQAGGKPEFYTQELRAPQGPPSSPQCTLFRVHT